MFRWSVAWSHFHFKLKIWQSESMTSTKERRFILVTHFMIVTYNYIAVSLHWYSVQPTQLPLSHWIWWECESNKRKIHANIYFRPHKTDLTSSTTFENFSNLYLFFMFPLFPRLISHGLRTKWNSISVGIGRVKGRKKRPQNETYTNGKIWQEKDKKKKSIARTTFNRKNREKFLSTSFSQHVTLDSLFRTSSWMHRSDPNASSEHARVLLYRIILLLFVIWWNMLDANEIQWIIVSVYSPLSSLFHCL